MSKSVLLDEGENALAQAQANKVAVKLGSFEVGDTANFNPSTSSTSISGNKVYTGSISQISTTVVQNDTIQFAITLDEGVGDFKMGNIVLFTDDGEAFMKMTLNNQVDKLANNQPQQIGNRLVFNIGLRYNNVDQLVDVNILTSTYSSPPPISDNNNIPNPGSANFDMYLLQNHSSLGTPTLALKRNQDDTWFGIPIIEPLKDGFFGVMDGGVDGDNNLRGEYIALGGGYIHNFSPNNTIDGGSLSNWSLDKEYDFGSL